MATNIDAKYGSGHATWAKIWKSLRHSRRGCRPHRVWTVASAAPTIDMGATTSLLYPVARGDFVYDIANDAVYVCTVPVAVATNATFVKCTP